MSRKIVIEISKTGMVNSHVSGVKGRGCLENLELLEELVGGTIVSHNLTDEYYQMQLEEEVENNQKELNLEL